MAEVLQRATPALTVEARETSEDFDRECITFRFRWANIIRWCYPSNAFGRFMLLWARSRNRGEGRPKRALWLREKHVLNVDQGGTRETAISIPGNKITAVN